MKIWEYEFMECMLENRQRKEMLLKELAKLPEGSLVRRKRGEKKEYYLYKNEKGNKIEKYLSEKDNSELISLLERTTERRKEIVKEIEFLDRVIKVLSPIAKSVKVRFIQPKGKFVATMSQKEDRYENLKYLTNRGEKVRSKSERFIADALFEFNLDYRYEQKLVLNEYTFHPDFTIINPLNGSLYYWEHLGMNDPEYTVDWLNRKEVYVNNGIIPGKNLIVTTEKDMDYFRKIVMNMFTFSRYDKIFDV